MLIEKERIEEAKQKLGDQNAFLMAELLELEKFDEKNLVACCPYHHEKTASFSYNKKERRFHCFGCDRTVDIIDVLIEKGYTFLDACKWLFDKADINYAFGEQHIQTKRNYIYPHEEPLNDRETVISFWKRRGISKATLDYLDVREDSKGNTVLNYYDFSDVLAMVKYRPSKAIDKAKGDIKNWCQKDADTTPLLWNANRCNTSKSLLIVEGEPDAMSCIEAGYLNTVSVPLGAGNEHWIEENFDWLEKFDEIILWFDNDEAGEKARKSVLYRLGTWKTKYIITPPRMTYTDGKDYKTKDANDVLRVAGKEALLNLINNAKDVPIDSVVDYSDIEELDISQMDGVETGIKPLDDELIKIFYGTLTVLSGRPGSGKTSIIDQTIAKTIDQGSPVFLFSKEMPERMSANWFNTVIAGRRNMEERTSRDGRKFHIVNKAIQGKMQEYYRGKLKIYKDSDPNDIDSVMESAEGCVRKHGAKLIVLDNLMMIDLECQEADKNTAQTNLINRLIKFASKFNVAVVLIAHPKKTPDANADIEMYDIAGTSNIINLAMRSIGLRRVSKKEKEDPKSKWSKYDVVLTIIKDRLLGKADLQMGLWYDLTSRRFYTDYEEYDMKFAWDDNEYTNKLPYVDRLHPSPDDIFPDK